MSDERKSQLIGRAWSLRAEGRVHLGDRHRGQDGSIVMTWHAPPNDHGGVIWLENLDGMSDEGSVS